MSKYSDAVSFRWGELLANLGRAIGALAAASDRRDLLTASQRKELEELLNRSRSLDQLGWYEYDAYKKKSKK